MASLISLPTRDSAAPFPLAALLAEPQTARLRLRVGRRGAVRAQVTVTPAGLLAVGGLVVAVLLSVVPVVHAAGKARARQQG